MIALYWDLGRQTKGFSRQNIQHMRAFYRAWSEVGPILPQAAGESVPAICPQPAGILGARRASELLLQLPWYHNIVLIEKLETSSDRLWYARQALAHGWSRSVLVHHIERKLHKRQGSAVTNFQAALSPPQSELVQQAIKDPYVFDFLTIAEYALRDSHKPMGVSVYKLLPTTRELEEGLGAKGPSRL